MEGKTTNGGLAEPAANPRIVPMRVIVCGLMRTGTLSESPSHPYYYCHPWCKAGALTCIGMRAALRQLGIHDVYHMQTTGTSPSDIPLWMRAIDAKYNGKGKFDREDWDQLLATHQVRKPSLPPAFPSVFLP